MVQEGFTDFSGISDSFTWWTWAFHTGGQFCDYCNSEDPRKAHPVTNAIDGSERWWQSPPLSSGTQYNKVNVTLDLGQGQFCDYCNSEDPRKAHPVTNAIDGSERWWQSPPLSSGTQYNKVNVTLDLGQLFHVAYVLIKFANSPRPDLWVLERSVDFGSTYSPWQYFAHSKIDCLEQFGQEANTALTRDDDVLCTTEYSRIVPLENGEVVVSLINGRPGAKNFTFSHTLREFTKATNIRLRFLRTNTLLGHLISKAQKDPTVTRRYYYSIKDISIGGRCVCNGHAEVCSANNPEKLGVHMPRFRCECQHHTCGETCDHCCAGYHQRLWRPATWEQSNECEACNCHGHAIDCYYDPEVERQQASLNIQGIYAGGGVCINCQHNTAGVNCETCAKGYYRPYGVPPDAPHGCIPCSCNPEHADDCEQGSGRCTCKPSFQGHNCEKCAPGHYNFPFCLRIPVFPIPTPSPEDPVAGDIRGCDCNLEGVLPKICDTRGRCLCRPGVEGPRCDACRVGFYSFPICKDAAQSKEIIFLPNKQPAFVTVPGSGFADPFSIAPGTWIACIKAEGVLLAGNRLTKQIGLDKELFIEEKALSSSAGGIARETKLKG
nr:laminin subunit alpha-3-like [Manis javanica]